MLLKAPLKLIELPKKPIYESLLIEEYLLRDTLANYCVINYGSPPAIVMGISGKEDELIHLEKACALNIPIIKRFSGGGTVVIDQQTLFITFICNAGELNVTAFPEAIYRFSDQFYTQVFQGYPYSFKQNDYLMGDKKCGGNAQYIKKGRWLHHTSFLWDYNKELMSLLKHPKKAPAYREGRSHEAFICRLKDTLPSQEGLINQIKNTLDTFFRVDPSFLLPHAPTPSRVSTHFIL